MNDELIEEWGTSTGISFRTSNGIKRIEPGKIYDKNLNEQPERSKREDLINELGKFKPKSLDPKDGYFPPPWDVNENLEKTIGWFEFQKAMKENPTYYLGS